MLSQVHAEVATRAGWVCQYSDGVSAYTTPSVVPVPLAEAVIEVRFPGDARIESLRGDFQFHIRDRLPALYVPRPSESEPMATRPYKFTNETQTEAVLLSLNLFAYSTQQYPGWEAFNALFHEYWLHVGERITPRRFTRVAVRYVNRFDHELRDQVRVHRGPAWLAPLSLAPTSHRSISRIKSDAGLDVTLQVGLEPEDDILTIDLDVAKTDVSAESLYDVLAELHAEVEARFAAALVPEYARTLGVASGDSGGDADA